MRTLRAADRGGPWVLVELVREDTFRDRIHTLTRQLTPSVPLEGR